MDNKVSRNHLDVLNIQDLKNFLGSQYARNLILKTDNIEILLLCLLPEQGTSRHNHGKSDGVTVILEGKLAYTNYYPDGSTESGYLESGDIEYIPVGVEHKIFNNSSSKVVMLNIYSPPLENMLGDTELKYANPVEINELKLPEKTIQFLKAALAVTNKDFNYLSKPNNILALAGDKKRKAIAIIGGGFSGTLVATWLMKKASEPTRIVLIERAPRFARGFAYSTNSLLHLLNVPVEKMSAFPNEPGHFINWAQSRDSKIQASSFVPRMMYGEYLESVLYEADLNKASNVKFDRLNDEAVSVQFKSNDSGAVIQLESGTQLVVDHIVLAVGNYPPRNPAVSENSFYSSDKYFRDPWAANVLTSLKSEEPVLLIGTGLTMLDKAIELKGKGHKDTIYAISRHGFLPQPHKSGLEAIKIDLNPKEYDSVRKLFQFIRKNIKDVVEKGGDWRQVIDALRPNVQNIWQLMSEKEKKRFFRHLRPHWDVHRHRMPPNISNEISNMVKTEMLKVVAGRILNYKEEQESVIVTIYDKKFKQELDIKVSRVINCTGSEFDFCQIQDPLVINLIEQGYIIPDKLSLGLEANINGALVDKNGKVSNILFTLGPPLKGQLWETTAVPEIREQACRLAEVLLGVKVHK